MSFHYPHSPGWSPYHQNQGGNIQQSEYQSRSRNNAQDAGVETQMQGSKYGSGYGIPVQDTASRRPGSNPYNGHSAYSTSFYQDESPDMQSLTHMMMHLRSQLEQLNHLIAQNNRLLQTMQNQEDTKCVQGNGGGAVIVRM